MQFNLKVPIQCISVVASGISFISNSTKKKRNYHVFFYFRTKDGYFEALTPCQARTPHTQKMLLKSLFSTCSICPTSVACHIFTTGEPMKPKFAALYLWTVDMRPCKSEIKVNNGKYLFFNLIAKTNIPFVNRFVHQTSVSCCNFSIFHCTQRHWII